MPLGKTRLPRVKSAPDAQPSVEGTGQFMSEAGKRTGQVVSGMFGFYGNVMKNAVGRIKEKRQEESPPPFG
jgi:hypothetical protein